MTNGLNSNSIHCILEGRDGKLWIGTEAGVCLYDGKTFAKIQIPLRKNRPPNKYRKTHNVFCIMQDKRGKLWFATIDGVYIYEPGADFLILNSLSLVSKSLSILKDYSQII